MSDRICPFSATLAKEDFSCPLAEQIIRRGGAEFACRSDADHTRCTQLFARLKAAALPAFELEDDLLAVPHGVLAKIQFGGLLGLQRLLGSVKPRVDDIASLVDAAATHYSDIEAIPCERLVGDIAGYKLSRRRKR